MNWNIFQRKKPQQVTEEQRSYGEALLYGLSSSYVSSKALTLSAVFAAVEKISNGLASLPISVFRKDTEGNKISLNNTEIYTVLNKAPNTRQTRFTFIKCLVCDMLQQGNAYAVIQRNNKGEVQRLIYVPAQYVRVTKPQKLDDELIYDVNFIGRVRPHDIIHIINYPSQDGTIGVSTLAWAKRTLSIATDAENTAQGFYRGGAAVSGILKSSVPLTKNQKQSIREAWSQSFSTVNGTPNSVALLEANLDFQPISINPEDAQLLSTREFSVQEIARFYNISPILLGDLSKASFATSEAAALNFLTQTLSPLLQKFELEFERKLFPNDNSIDIRFDTNTLLRGDKAASATYYNTMLYNGTYSINEVRKELDMQPIENGDTHFIQAQLLNLNNAVNNTTVMDKTIASPDEEQINEEENTDD